MVCFHCPTLIPIPIIVPIPIVCRSAPLGPIPMQKLQWKLVKLHLISTDGGAKMGTVPIGIGIGACIGIGVGSVETVLHITIEANSIGIGIGDRSRAVENHTIRVLTKAWGWSAMHETECNTLATFYLGWVAERPTCAIHITARWLKREFTKMN